MVENLKGVLEDFPEVITGIRTSLKANNMFQVRPEDDQTLLYKEQATQFHQTMPQLLFDTSRARKYIKMAIDFLRTPVRTPYKYGWGKLVRVIRYIIGTLHISLILRGDNPSVIKWWVDESFAAYPD